MEINGKNTDKEAGDCGREQREKREAVQCFFLVLQVGLAMMVPIAVCGFLGWLIGRAVGADYFIIIGIFLGAATGYRSVYDMIKKYIKNPKRPEGVRSLSESELHRLEAEKEFEAWKTERDEDEEED